jgi:hypothetical protein
MTGISDRGGHGGVMIGSKPYFPASDGKGCPACGAVYPGGHGGYCPYGRHFDSDGKEVSADGMPVKTAVPGSCACTGSPGGGGSSR